MPLQDPRDTKGTGGHAGESREKPEEPEGTRTRGGPRDAGRTGGNEGTGADRKAIRTNSRKTSNFKGLSCLYRYSTAPYNIGQ